MPYNKTVANGRKRIDVSSDSISDIPVYRWDLPPALALQNVQRMMLMWLDFAR